MTLNPLLLLALLPWQVRRVLYWTVVILGLGVLVCHAFDIAVVWVVDVDRLEGLLVIVGPAVGLTGVANLSRADRRRRRGTTGRGFDPAPDHPFKPSRNGSLCARRGCQQPAFAHRR